MSTTHNVIAVRLHPDTRRELDRVAKRMGATLSQVVREAIERDLAVDEREALPATRAERTKLRRTGRKRKHGRHR